MSDVNGIICKSFNKGRLEKYYRAHELCPNARELELVPLHFLDKTNSDQKVLPKALDVASGTGYLTKELINLRYDTDTIDPVGGPINGATSHFQCNVTNGLPDELPDDSNPRRGLKLSSSVIC